MICSYCHKEVKPGKFCENCGSILKEEGKVQCRSCHNFVKEGRFCQICGSTLEAEVIEVKEPKVENVSVAKIEEKEQQVENKNIIKPEVRESEAKIEKKIEVKVASESKPIQPKSDIQRKKQTSTTTPRMAPQTGRGAGGNSSKFGMIIVVVIILLFIGGVMWKLYLDRGDDSFMSLKDSPPKASKEVTEIEEEQGAKETLEESVDLDKGYGMAVNQIDTVGYPEIKLYIGEDGIKDFNISKISIEEKSGDSYEPVIIKNSQENLGGEIINFNIVVDNSKNMAKDEAMEELKTAVRDTLNTLDYSSTHAGIVSVNSKVTVNNYITDNYEALNNGLTALVPDGERAIYDGIITSLEELNKNEGPKLLVVFASGVDTASKNDYTKVMARAKEVNIPVFVIGYDEKAVENYSEFEKLAAETNGKFYSVSNISSISSILQELLSSFKSSYVVTFETKVPMKSEDELLLQVSYVDSGFTASLESSATCMVDTLKESLIKYDSDKEKILEMVKNYTSNAEGRYSIYYGNVDMGFPMIVNDASIRSASVIKIFIMIEALAQIDKKLLDGNKLVTMNSCVGGTGVIQYEHIGSQFTVYELLEYMMIDSDNTAANMLIDEVGGVAVVNAKIKELGCVNSQMNRKLLDMEALRNGQDNYVTVYDMGNILTKIYNKQCISEEADSYMLQLMHRNKNQNKIPYDLPENVNVFNKTGEFDDYGVQNDVAIVETEKGAYVLCVLTEGGNSQEEIGIIRRLSKDIYNEFIK